ncbi:hypothetical protein L6164_013036 [Bauhinia variegata]|uniref:Uncharacterized protein n=1 Tax=Bauhinia variegata TaxID=167791 RepID=A0ACB9PBU7_BAUVA|nr:hypothetical protein L6164_013036 [Bauhinia variegata]
MASTSMFKASKKPYLSAPYLLFPSTKQETYDHMESPDRSLFNLSEKTFYESKHMFKGLENAHCVGSSQGWLLVLDENAVPFIFNPFSSARFQWPSFHLAWTPLLRQPCFLEYAQKHLISKAVLRCEWEPLCQIRRFIVIIIFGFENNLALCRSGETTWIPFPSSRSYSDMIFLKSQLYAVTNDGFLQVWGLEAWEPNRVFEVKLSIKVDEEEIRSFPADKFSARFYLVETKGRLLLVKRIIGDMVNSEGIAIDEAYLLESEDTHPLVCPYRTMHFYVYEIDSITGVCEKVELLLNGEVLFVGGNESASLSAWVFRECEVNSIYFTDDRWDGVEDYLYGGHDLGIFNLQDKDVKRLIPYRYDRDKIEPAPIWIFPTPSSSFHQL